VAFTYRASWREAPSTSPPVARRARRAESLSVGDDPSEKTRTVTVSRMPSLPSTFPIMSLLMTPVRRHPSSAAIRARVCPPSSPFSSPESAAYTIEPRKRCTESTRAASRTAETPLALSLAPGLESRAFMMSETRLSMSPLRRTKRSGSVAPRWMAITLTTSVGPGTRLRPE